MNTKALRITLLAAAILGSATACAAQAQSPAASSRVATPTGRAASASAGASSTAVAVGASASDTPSSQSTVDPNTYVAAAWLNAQQIPLAQAGVTDWVLQSSVTGTHIGGEVLATTPAQSATWCTDLGIGGLGSLTPGLVGGQLEMFDGSNSDKILPNGAIPAYAHQATLFYGDTAEASAAWNGLAASFGACAKQITGVDPTTGQYIVGSARQTLSQPNAECWSVLADNKAGTSGSIDHDCFVRSGSLIEELNVEEHQVSSFATQSFTSIDATLVPQLQAALADY